MSTSIYYEPKKLTFYHGVGMEPKNDHWHTGINPFPHSLASHMTVKTSGFNNHGTVAMGCSSKIFPQCFVDLKQTSKNPDKRKIEQFKIRKIVSKDNEKFPTLKETNSNESNENIVIKTQLEEMDEKTRKAFKDCIQKELIEFYHIKDFFSSLRIRKVIKKTDYIEKVLPLLKNEIDRDQTLLKSLNDLSQKNKSDCEDDKKLPSFDGIDFYSLEGYKKANTQLKEMDEKLRTLFIEKVQIDLIELYEQKDTAVSNHFQGNFTKSDLYDVFLPPLNAEIDKNQFIRKFMIQHGFEKE